MSRRGRLRALPLAGCTRMCTHCAEQLHGVSREDFELLCSLLPRGAYLLSNLTVLCDGHMADYDAGVSPRDMVTRDSVSTGIAAGA